MPPPPPPPSASALTEQQQAELHLLSTLTLSDSSDQCVPKKIDALDGVHIVGVSAGHRHVLGLAEDGKVYSWGSGGGGCLGHGDLVQRNVPEVVDEVRRGEERRGGEGRGGGGEENSSISTHFALTCSSILQLCHLGKKVRVCEKRSDRLTERFDGVSERHEAERREKGGAICAVLRRFAPRSGLFTGSRLVA